MEVAGPFSIATSYLWGVVTWGQWLHLDQNGDSDGFHQEKNPWEYDGICRTYSQPKSI
jgi:hypothetical protein